MPPVPRPSQVIALREQFQVFDAVCACEGVSGRVRVYLLSLGALGPGRNLPYLSSWTGALLHERKRKMSEINGASPMRP